MGRIWSYWSSVRLLRGHVVAEMVSMLLLVVVRFRGLSHAAHLRWRSEGSHEVGVRRIRLPAPSRTVVVGVLEEEGVSEVDDALREHARHEGALLSEEII